MAEEETEKMTDEERLEKIEDLLSDSLDTLKDKKTFEKSMNTMLKDCAKRNGLDVKDLKKIKTYMYYKGADWLNGNPLLKDPTKTDKDKISPTFIRLLELFDQFNSIGYLDFLSPYLDALKEQGITITYENKSKLSLKDTPENIKETIESASKLQTNVNTLDEQIKGEKSEESEKLLFTPKKQFNSALGIYEKINDEKDVKDKIQSTLETSLMITNAYTYLSSLAENVESEEE